MRWPRATTACTSMAGHGWSRRTTKGASEAFRKIPDYLDSLGQAEICDYHRAVQLMEQQAYDAAAPLLESAGSYADAAELLQQCRYQQAKTAVENSDYQSAEQLLAGLNGYQDSESLLQDVRYQLAQTAISRGDYAAALETLDLLGRYQDSEALKNQCRYQLAQVAVRGGGLCLRRWKTLPSWATMRTASQWAKDTEEKIAQSYQESGDVQAALENVGKLDDDAGRGHPERNDPQRGRAAGERTEISGSHRPV